jgi:hypothetical protein
VRIARAKRPGKARADEAAASRDEDLHAFFFGSALASAFGSGL